MGAVLRPDSETDHRGGSGEGTTEEAEASTRVNRQQSAEAPLQSSVPTGKQEGKIAQQSKSGPSN